MVGALALANGEHAEYQAICREMVKRFRQRGEGDEQGVRLSVLSPDSGVPFSDLKNLMPPLSLIREETRFRCFFILTTGMLEYRSGHPAAAIRLLKMVQTERFPAALVSAAAGLSMANHHLGDMEAARSELTRARAVISPFWPKGPAQPGAWWDWLAADLLLQEAEKLIGSTGSSQGATPAVR